MRRLSKLAVGFSAILLFVAFAVGTVGAYESNGDGWVLTDFGSNDEETGEWVWNWEAEPEIPEETAPEDVQIYAPDIDGLPHAGPVSQNAHGLTVFWRRYNIYNYPIGPCFTFCYPDGCHEVFEGYCDADGCPEIDNTAIQGLLTAMKEENACFEPNNGENVWDSANVWGSDNLPPIRRVYFDQKFRGKSVKLKEPIKLGSAVLGQAQELHFVGPVIFEPEDGKEKVINGIEVDVRVTGKSVVIKDVEVDSFKNGINVTGTDIECDRCTFWGNEKGLVLGNEDLGVSVLGVKISRSEFYQNSESAIKVIGQEKLVERNHRLSANYFTRNFKNFHIRGGLSEDLTLSLEKYSKSGDEYTIKFSAPKKLESGAIVINRAEDSDQGKDLTVGITHDLYGIMFEVEFEVSLDPMDEHCGEGWQKEGGKFVLTCKFAEGEYGFSEKIVAELRRPEFGIAGFTNAAELMEGLAQDPPALEPDPNDPPNGNDLDDPDGQDDDDPAVGNPENDSSNVNPQVIPLDPGGTGSDGSESGETGEVDEVVDPLLAEESVPESTDKVIVSDEISGALIDEADDLEFGETKIASKTSFCSLTTGVSDENSSLIAILFGILVAGAYCYRTRKNHG